MSLGRMGRRSSRILVALLAAGPALVLASVARASGGLEVPDSGAFQVGRGSAWVARADDPMAAYMNPAAMSFQASGVHLGAHLMIQSGCFLRVGADGEPVSPGNNIPGPGDANGPDAEYCNTSVFPNPQLSAVFRFIPRLALGVSVAGPHAVGNVDWGESVDFTIAENERTQPAPSRYLLVSQSSVVIFPTISVSYAIIPDELAIGAGFVWGVAHASFTTFTESTSANGQDDFTRDVKAELSADDFFVPGFVVGLNWRANRYFDFGAWFRWSDHIDANSDLHLESNYWLAGGTPNENPCGTLDEKCNITDREDAGTFRLAIPMEAKIGARYHHPHPNPKSYPKWSLKHEYVRDPLSQDLFDAEVDFTWANNSAVDIIEIRNQEGILVNGTPGSVPPNGDIPHEWKDVLGVRWGGDFTLVQNFLAVRAGGFFESSMQRDEYLNLDFHGGFKVGGSVGSTVRLGPADLTLAYQGVYFETMDNGGQGVVKALSGDASTGYRSQQNVNGGRLSQQMHELALGGTFRY